MPSLPTRLATAAARALVARADAVDVRADTTATTTYNGAAVSNGLSGLGGARDSGTSARPNIQRDYLDSDELVALLRGTVYRRVVELHPRWATVRGWTLTDDTDDDKPLHEAMRRVGLRRAIRQADTWGRALGEARILLVTDDPAPMDQPLDIRRVRRLHRLEVLDRREFTPVAYESNVAEGEIGLPVLYQVTPQRASVGFQGMVHASRLLRFYGDELPPSERGFALGTYEWGADAVGQTLWDGLRHLSQAGAGGARLAQELSVAVFKLKRAAAVGGGDQAADLASRLGVLNVMKSIANAVFLTPEDSYERVNANATGFKDLSEHARLELSLLTGIPMSLLWGEAPGGLNTDGQSWQASWHATIASHQEERYRDAIETVVRCLYWSEVGEEPGWSLEFNPLGQLTEREKAEIREIVSRTDGQAVLDGIISAQEARTRYTAAGGFAYDLQVLEQEPERAAPPVVEPEQEAAARAMIERALAQARGDALDDEFRTKRFKVPASARNRARRVLAWKAEYGEAVRGMTQTGWARARQLANEETVTGQDLIEIAAWFARHGAQASTEKVAPEYADEPWRDAGHVSWLGWGGDTMRGYAAGVVERNRRSDATEGAVWIGVVLPESAREAWAEARRMVEAVTGPLVDPGEDPHVTVLWMGQVDPTALPEVVEIAREVAERGQPHEAEAEHARVFAPSQGSEGLWPVVLDVSAWGLWALHEQLLRRLAHLVTARQFPAYAAHLTLGYAEDLTPEQRTAIAELELPEAEWMVGGLQVRYGRQTVATLPLAGRVDAAQAAK